MNLLKHLHKKLPFELQTTKLVNYFTILDSLITEVHATAVKIDKNLDGSRNLKFTN